MSKVAVLGGGLSGRLMAFQLAEQGVAVELFEKGERNGAQAAAYVAAAMLAPSSEAVEATPEVIRLGRQSFALWRGILGRLNTPVMMQEKGSLIVWHTQDKPLSAEFARHLKRGGVPEHETIRWNADEIAANEPQLAGRFSDGLYLPTEGQLDGRQVLNALADALESMNVPCHWLCEREVEDLAAQYDWVIDCRGYGAKAAWNRPSESQLRGIRGEVARVYAPEVELSRPVRLLHPRYPVYCAEGKPYFCHRCDPNRKRKPSAGQRAFRFGTFVRAVRRASGIWRGKPFGTGHRPAPDVKPSQSRNPLQPRTPPD